MAKVEVMSSLTVSCAFSSSISCCLSFSCCRAWSASNFASAWSWSHESCSVRCCSRSCSHSSLEWTHGSCGHINTQNQEESQCRGIKLKLTGLCQVGAVCWSDCWRVGSSLSAARSGPLLAHSSQRPAPYRTTAAPGVDHGSHSSALKGGKRKSRHLGTLVPTSIWQKLPSSTTAKVQAD